MGKRIHPPEQLWLWFLEYQIENRQNPVKFQDFVGSAGKEVIKESQRPLTLWGFKNYCRRMNYSKALNHYFLNTDDNYKEYQEIVDAIKSEINQDIVDGGMTGRYHPRISASLLGLEDKDKNQDAQPVTNVLVQIVSSPAKLANSEDQVKLD